MEKELYSSENCVNTSSPVSWQQRFPEGKCMRYPNGDKFYIRTCYKGSVVTVTYSDEQCVNIFDTIHVLTINGECHALPEQNSTSQLIDSDCNSTNIFRNFNF